MGFSLSPCVTRASRPLGAQLPPPLEEQYADLTPLPALIRYISYVDARLHPPDLCGEQFSCTIESLQGAPVWTLSCTVRTESLFPMLLNAFQRSLICPSRGAPVLPSSRPLPVRPTIAALPWSRDDVAPTSKMSYSSINRCALGRAVVSGRSVCSLPSHKDLRTETMFPVPAASC